MTKFTPITRATPYIATGPAFVSLTMRVDDPASDILVRHVRLLRDCVALARQRWGFTIEAAVVLPGELQLLCGFSDTQFGVRGALDLIMSGFRRHLPTVEGRIWADETEIIEIATPVVALRCAFMENAPVRAGLVKTAADWPFSSAHKSVAQASDLGVAVA